MKTLQTADIETPGVQVFRDTRGASDGWGADIRSEADWSKRGRAWGGSQKSGETMNTAVIISFRYGAAIHQIVSEVLDARMFWPTNFICLKSKRKDI